MALWFPSNSLEEKHKNQEHANTAECTPTKRQQKRRKVTVKIERRKEATVNTQAVSASTVSEIGAPSLSDSSGSKGYSTIENTSSNDLDRYANWKESHQDESTVCGWKNSENIPRLVMMNQPLNDSKNSIQTKIVSDRLYSSRVNTQIIKKREQYQFTHADTPEEHMRVYREHCSYSYLLLYNRRRPNTVAATITGLAENNEVDEQIVKHEFASNNNTRSTYFPKPVTAMGTLRKVMRSVAPDTKVPSIPSITTGKISRTERDRVLHSLANRLGVNESIDEPKLLSPVTRRTPPSITKKKTTAALKEDLVLQPCTEKNGTSSSNSESQPIAKQSKQRHTPQLLPNIQNQRKKSTSSISLSKYFHVNVHQSNTNEHDEVEPSVQDEDEDTVLPPHYSSNITPPLSPQDEDSTSQKSTALQHSDKWPLFTSSVDPLGSFVQKEEAIKRKANSLGLMSHKWAKNFIERGFKNGHLSHKIYYEYSRQSTQESNRSANTAQAQKNAGCSGKSSAVKQNEKLKELKELYAVSNNSGRKKRENNSSSGTSGIHKQHSSHRNNTRPPTRTKRNKANHLDKEELENAFKKLQEFKLHTQALLK